MASSRSTRAQRLQARSQDRRDSERQELRQRMLDAAGALFLQHGYTGFSLRQVAEQIGYSPGTIYLYFRDKDDLLFHVADAGFHVFRASQQQAANSSTDPRQRLRAAARAYVQFGLDFPAYYRLMFVERPDLMFQQRVAETSAWLETLVAYQGLFAAVVGPAEHHDSAMLQAHSDAWWATLHGLVTLATSMTMVFDSARTSAALDAALERLFASLPAEG